MISRELKAASTKPLILSILSRGESYGYRILQDVADLSGGDFEWSEAMLYPVLHRLNKEGLIASRWILMENGRKRKYYGLTETGRRALETEKTQWLNVHTVLMKLWGPQPQLSLG